MKKILLVIITLGTGNYFLGSSKDLDDEIVPIGSYVDPNALVHITETASSRNLSQGNEPYGVFIQGLHLVGSPSNTDRLHVEDDLQSKSLGNSNDLHRRSLHRPLDNTNASDTRHHSQDDNVDYCTQFCRWIASCCFKETQQKKV